MNNTTENRKANKNHFICNVVAYTNEMIFIAIVLVLSIIILPMVHKVKSDFSTIQKTLENG